MFLLSFTTDLTDWTDGCGGIRQKPEKPLGEDGGLCPCCPMRMVIHVSELPCPPLPIRLVCPLADGKHQIKIAAEGSTK